MAGPLLQFLLCATIIVIAGTFLTRFADAIAELTGLGRLVVGSVLLAGATSLPELTVDIAAIRLGAADLAVGDLMGSSLVNLLILAVLDLSFYSGRQLFSRQGVAHALSGIFSASMATVVALCLLTAKLFEPYAVAGISPASLLILLAYLAGVRLIYFDQQMAMRGSPEHAQEEPPAPAGTTTTKALVGFAVCALVILITGPHLAEAGDELAEVTGLGKTFVGTTFIALSTSLPELVSMIAALRMKAVDLAIGNVFGSNAFNMLLLVPLDLLHRDSLLADVSQRHVITCVAGVLATQVAVLGVLYKVEVRRRFIDPDAWLVIMVVVGALALIYYLPN